MPVILFFVVILLIGVIISIVRGIIDFLENDFFPFFFNAGEIIAIIALVAISIAIIVTIIIFIFLFFKAKIIPILKRYRLKREIKETEKAMNYLLSKPLDINTNIDYDEITEEKFREIERMMKKKSEIVENHIKDLKDLHKRLTEEGK